MDLGPKLVTSKELQNIFTNIMTMFFSSPKHEIGRRNHEEYIYMVMLNMPSNLASVPTKMALITPSYQKVKKRNKIFCI